MLLSNRNKLNLFFPIILWFLYFECELCPLKKYTIHFQCSSIRLNVHSPKAVEKLFQMSKKAYKSHTHKATNDLYNVGGYTM